MKTFLIKHTGASPFQKNECSSHKPLLTVVI